MAQSSSQRGLHRWEHEHDACGMGFLVQIHKQASHGLVSDGLTALERMAHRGAVGCEDNSGDGAGVLVQLPWQFLRRACEPLGIQLPEPGDLGVGMVFVPRAEQADAKARAMFEETVASEGQKFLGWRRVPTDNHALGRTARLHEPRMYQAFIQRQNFAASDPQAFERKLYIIRKRYELALDAAQLPYRSLYYCASLSSRTLVYKGMLTPEQVRGYFPDLSHPYFQSAIILFHSRFSTNTFPSWRLAHPYRMIVHNGEINTLRGNKNWMQARETFLESSLLGDDVKKIVPVIRDGASDSAAFDAVLELLVMGGRSLPHAIMMMVPEAWENDTRMSNAKRAFYAYHDCLMEPWDGPASIAFTDGHYVGAVLDRNGLRPSRYYVTDDGRVMLASEVGVFDVAVERIVKKGRLLPGKMLLIDLHEGRVVDDKEIKDKLAKEQPYETWIQQYMRPVSSLPVGKDKGRFCDAALEQRQRAFGYTLEDKKFILGPMAQSGKEALGSMGNDTALAVLSDQPQPLYNYFKQLFAQVTNPPLDAIREELVTSMQTTLGPESNLLAPSPKSCRSIQFESPIIDNQALARIARLNEEGFVSRVLPIMFSAKNDRSAGAALKGAMEDLCRTAVAAIHEGATILILSDRDTNEEHVAIPALLALSGLHHHLVTRQLRTRVALVVETGETREVHHFALLLGYGATVINPYLALDSIEAMRIGGELAESLSATEAQANYLKAATGGVLKVMSKMGISTVDSYRGAQIFEAVGLAEDFIDAYFTHTASRIGGVGIDEIAADALVLHRHAYALKQQGTHDLPVGGQYQWRRDGEYHLFNPETVFRLQHATRQKRYDIFREYSDQVDENAARQATLRSLMRFESDRPPINISEVEPVENIFKRFTTGAMSYGSISAEAHETLAIAMNRIGGKSNSGEGGEDPARFTPEPNGDSRRSAVKQVASGRFGVNSHYLVNADEIQIKMAQGAKPGEGGQLPGNKVWPWIAKVRFSTPGVGLISPPPHHDIYSIEDLAQLIHDLKNANPSARINVKLVAEAGVGTVAAGVAKAKADVILISGHDGGTGASPLTSIKHAGLPWELGLAETQQTLVRNQLRERVVLQVDGQLKTGRDVIIGALLGAEEFGFATAPLVVMGCVMMRVCQLDTCPVGIATQNPELRKKFTGKTEHLVHFFEFIAQDVRRHMASLGYATLDELIGRVDLLRADVEAKNPKVHSVDFDAILHRPDEARHTPARCVTQQDHGLHKALDKQLIRMCERTLQTGAPVVIDLPIRNTHRTVGTMLGAEVTRLYGPAGLSDNTIRLNFVGSAGQSFGAFVPSGITLSLEGDANDYVGKGLSGGIIVVRPPRHAPYIAEDNILIGNVALYGATSGAAYFRGIAGERFCVRNSGAVAVVEGVGDHGCEYMTGGRVVVLGPTGRNFAAGMSGGIAYVYDPKQRFASRCNHEMVLLERVESDEESEQLQAMIQAHLEYTQSEVAHRLLERWTHHVSAFVKVMPTDYRRVLDAQQHAAA